MNVPLNASVPQDVCKLRSFLDILTYCAKFLPNLKITLSPLHSLHILEKRKTWSLGEELFASKTAPGFSRSLNTF